jgi:hypothetical protein
MGKFTHLGRNGRQASRIFSFNKNFGTPTLQTTTLPIPELDFEGTYNVTGPVYYTNRTTGITTLENQIIELTISKIDHGNFICTFKEISPNTATFSLVATRSIFSKGNVIMSGTSGLNTFTLYGNDLYATWNFNHSSHVDQSASLKFTRQ